MQSTIISWWGKCLGSNIFWSADHLKRLLKQCDLQRPILRLLSEDYSFLKS